LTSWDDKREVKKGKIGERIIKSFLENKGYIVYTPNTAGAHAFDFLAIKDKEKAIIAESKTYPKRKFYNDTGIDIKNYYKYKIISENHNMPVFLFFIDDVKNEIYGNWLSELEKEYNDGKIKYPLRKNGKTGIKIYFSLNSMRHISFLNGNEIKEIKQFNNFSNLMEEI